jgi:hypothetical protein
MKVKDHLVSLWNGGISTKGETIAIGQHFSVNKQVFLSSCRASVANRPQDLQSRVKP